LDPRRSPFSGFNPLSQLYFTAVNANEIRRVGLDGKNYEALIKNVTCAVSISLYSCP
jgi:hypothetical protein